MATDTTIAWGTDFEKSWGEGDNRYFRKFWRNVVRWLTENSDGANRRLRVETDKVIYRPGQPIEVTARAYDEKLAETDRYRVVARLRRPTEERVAAVRRDRCQPGPPARRPRYRGKLTAPPASEILEKPGSTVHTLVLDVAAFDGEQVAARSSTDLQVIDDPAEFRDPRPNPAALKRARPGHGRTRDPDPRRSWRACSAGIKTRSVADVVTRWPLWDTPLLWLLLLGLLSSEWILRRLKGLA